MIKFIVCATLAATTLAAPFLARSICDGSSSCCDKSDMCAELISTGEKTCAADFCSSCNFAGFCDESCDTCGSSKPSGGGSGGNTRPDAAVVVTADEMPQGVFTLSFETTSTISGFEMFNDGRDETNCVLNTVDSVVDDWSFTLGDSTGTVVGQYSGKNGATGSGNLCMVSGTVTNACAFAFEDASGNELTYSLTITHGGNPGGDSGGGGGSGGNVEPPCQDLIDSGERTCKDDFCSTCPFAGYCDSYC